MLVSDPGPWTKLGWKGVDIVANALSGLALAAVALVSWRFQQGWLRRIQLKHKTEDRSAARRTRLAVLCQEKESLKQQVSSTNNSPSKEWRLCQAGELASQVCAWLERTKLRFYAENHHSFANLSEHPQAWDTRAQMGSHVHFVASNLEEIELQPINDDSFEW